MDIIYYKEVYLINGITVNFTVIPNSLLLRINFKCF